MANVLLRLGPRRSKGGFTLLELLVVLVIFGLIMAALTQGALFSRKAWNTQERLVEKQGDLLSLQNFLRQLLQSATAFKGSSKTLNFEGKLPHALAMQGLFDVELRVSDNRLVLAWRQHIDGASTPSDMIETELASDVRDLIFSYYVEGSKNQPAGWKNEISASSSPPAIIKTDVFFDEGSPKSWPSLSVAPRLERAAQSKS